MNKKISKFVESKRKDVKKVADAYPKDGKSLIVDYDELEKYDLKVAEGLLATPDEILDMFNAALESLGIQAPIPDARFRVRFTNLPKDCQIKIKYIASEHIGKMISVEGIINRISDVLPKVNIGNFVCGKCGEVHMVPQTKRALTEPLKCKNCERREFRFDPEKSKFIDVQRLEIQEPLEMLKGGEEARKIEVWVEEDMTDRATAGEKVIVNGILRLMPPKVKGPVYYKFLDANHIAPVEKEFEDIDISEEEIERIKSLGNDPKIYERVINSIAPSVWGHREVKESIALQLFGGRSGKKLADGTHVRSDIHLLLIGDPGVAKSRILQYVDQIAPKSIYVSGKGTTGAGLTATAERDEFAEGAWTLKAGALVLAGGGIACIDEFDKMDKDDRSAMHEAMEQQTISVAKAGIIAKFKANTSVLAASNPKFSRFDIYKPLGEQFDVPPTLLSRFDLIFPIRDVLDSEQDRKIAQYILKMHKGEKEMKEITPDIEVDLFRKYISYARTNVSPVLTDDAAKKIEDYYVDLRARSAGGSVTATARQLEALIRLAEASAKMRLSNTATVSDVERAVNLTNFVLREIATDETGRLDIDRIVTDHPKSTRDKIVSIEDIIRDVASKSPDKLASIEDVKSEAYGKNIDKSDFERIINELRNKGIIAEVKGGKLRWIE